MKKKFPVKSNWISYKRENDGAYTVRNHLIDEEFELSKLEITFLESLNGKVDPYKKLEKYLGMTGREAKRYLYNLRLSGLIRYDNKIDDFFLQEPL